MTIHSPESSGKITIHVSEQEIRTPSCDRIADLLQQQGPRGLNALQGSVRLVLPKTYSARFSRMTFENPEIRHFGILLRSSFPGFSFFADLPHINVFKQIAFATMPKIRSVRNGKKIVLAIDEHEWESFMRVEMMAVQEFAMEAGFCRAKIDQIMTAIVDRLHDRTFR